MRKIETVKDNFIRQAAYCSDLGSPLYARLLPDLVECLDESQGIYNALSHWPGDPHDDAVALRFVAALNYLVITGQAPSLKPIFDSRTYSASANEKHAIRESLVEHSEFIVEYLKLPPQTNEVGRCGALLGGFLEIANCFGANMSVFEIGASAGLNLFFDQYLYQTEEWAWGNKSAQVQFDIDWRGAPPRLSAIKVAERHACDQSPVDLSTDYQRLLSYVWPDQLKRVARLKAAIEQTRESMTSIDKANASDWLSLQAERDLTEHTRVFYHSIIWQYFSSAEQARFQQALEHLAKTATEQSPLVWLRFEPAADKPCAELRLKSWPGAADHLLAESGFHGDWVNWFGMEPSE